MSKKQMSIVLEDGTIDQAELLFAFEFNDTKKEYVVYTKNEVDQNGNITIYVTEVVKDENGELIVKEDNTIDISPDKKE